MPLLSKNFPHLSRIVFEMRRVYRKLFSVQEIESSSQLQWMLGASLLYLFFTFNNWAGNTSVTVEAAQQGRAVCWPYFQHCSDYFFLHMLPYGYSQTIFYMVLYGVMMLIVWAMWRQKWTTAHALYALLILWEMAVVYVFSFQSAAPYHYYHIILGLMLIFASHKEFFLKLSFVLMYFLSATTKIDSTWILGSYFTSLENGLPIFPGWSTPLLTNAVMFMQMIGSWFLISKRAALRHIAFVYFMFFHFYSGVFVLYEYPTVTLPTLAVLFGPMYRYTPIPFGRKTIVGWVILVIVCAVQALGFIAPGDRRITMEGNKFGMFMFEANHQCAVTITSYTDTKVSSSTPGFAPDGCSGQYCHTRSTSKRTAGILARTDVYESGSSWNRCYPYIWWSKLHLQCGLRPGLTRVALRIDHSINGGPFYRIVDEPDVCSLSYLPFGPNSWIKSPPEAPAIGLPVRNAYHY